ncbi:hypothetical protein DDE84_05950 [Bifidobacterium tibiigranuli]|uniref:Uncharacterized protein n=2 Tax=Bifidobacterium TaxID=1678 RepID=A0A5N6S3X9_9BIFI|nr:hypothetical protein DDE84_05950 [Bifidobacterium tibiigranuli]KAE8128559.1 hypothetical protein DDF78_05395 [Bifidobacterium tibiigranuli]
MGRMEEEKQEEWVLLARRCEKMKPTEPWDRPESGDIQRHSEVPKYWLRGGPGSGFCVTLESKCACIIARDGHACDEFMREFDSEYIYTTALSELVHVTFIIDNAVHAGSEEEVLRGAAVSETDDGFMVSLGYPVENAIRDILYEMAKALLVRPLADSIRFLDAKYASVGWNPKRKEEALSELERLELERTSILQGDVFHDRVMKRYEDEKHLDDQMQGLRRIVEARDVGLRRMRLATTSMLEAGVFLLSSSEMLQLVWDVWLDGWHVRYSFNRVLLFLLIVAIGCTGVYLAWHKRD